MFHFSGINEIPEKLKHKLNLKLGAKTIYGKTAQQLAAENGHSEVVSLLRERSASQRCCIIS